MSADGDHNHAERQQTVSKNIESIIKLEEEDERRLSSIHRASHRVGWFVGTVHFVISQLALVVLWALWNLYRPSPFDPYPFPLLSAFLALEAVLLTSFVLIRQNAMDLQSERRNHLDLQINLLAEREADSILRALGAIAAKFDIELPRDAGNDEAGRDTQVESIARDLRSQKDEASA
jgi:uncharacterized membrane protein